MTSQIRAMALMLLGSAIPSTARDGDTEYLYLENSKGGDIYVLELPGHKRVDRIELGVYLDDVTFSEKGDVLYANRILSGGKPDALWGAGVSGEIYAISTSTHKIIWKMPVPGIPNHLTVSKDDRYLFVPLFNTSLLYVIDTTKRAVVHEIEVGYGPHGTLLSPDGKRLYVGCMIADQVTVIDVATFKPVKRIPFEEGVRPFAITPDEKTLYAQQSRLHGFVVVDLEKNKVVRKIHLPLPASDVKRPTWFPHTYNHGLALTPDGSLLFAAGSIADIVAIYSVPDLKLVATVPVGRDPNWIIFNNDGTMCYVSNRKSNDISVISVARRKEVARIKVGNYPQRMKTLVKSK